MGRELYAHIALRSAPSNPRFQILDSISRFRISPLVHFFDEQAAILRFGHLFDLSRQLSYLRNLYLIQKVAVSEVKESRGQLHARTRTFTVEEYLVRNGDFVSETHYTDKSTRLHLCPCMHTCLDTCQFKRSIHFTRTSNGSGAAPSPL